MAICCSGVAGFNLRPALLLDYLGGLNRQSNRHGISLPWSTQPSIPPGQANRLEYRPAWLRRGVFTCVRWQAGNTVAGDAPQL